MPTRHDEPLTEIVNRERSRLRSFIRRRVRDPRDAEDILQDVFSALVEANRLLMPIDHLTGWLYRVARNRIIDLFRTRTTESLQFEDLLPSRESGPEAEYARHELMEALEQAIAELPQEQREVFVAHELEGRSFKDISATTGVGINTLLSRKRYAVLRLRERLIAIVGAPIMIALFIVAGGGVVMLLWNWLLPPLFGWPSITLLQGFGLLALCRILFGGFGKGGGPSQHWSPEDKERIRRRMSETPPPPLAG